jgi:diadenosine tetraphosphatase ApaH/serine/threonine PP2A family protein phosphatase
LKKLNENSQNQIHFEMSNVHAMIRSILQNYIQETPKSNQWATSTQVISIISQAIQIFSNEPALLNLSGVFTVVGDLHGELSSLLRIFQRLGWPDSRCYLFLGDYVDRGESSCEILVLLYCLKILFPHNIFLLRGNHEFPSMTKLYGFQIECVSRFLMNVYFQFLNSFITLPIAAIINDSIFCVHGGISPNLTTQLDELHKIEELTSNVENDILWSDPNENIEGFQPNPRGRGFIFGFDVFNEFLQQTELTMMIRGHEYCSNGFTWSFGKDGGLLTIFSVIDYCGKGNDGAVVIVNESDVTIDRFKYGDRFRILIPYFILKSITNTFNDFTLPRSDDSSHRYLEIC